MYFYIIVILTFSTVFFRIQATIFDREGRFMTDGNTIRSVAKAMELLQLLSDAGEAMTLTAISERAGLPKSTVFGLLTTMRYYDVITHSTQTANTPSACAFLNTAAAPARSGTSRPSRGLTSIIWQKRPAPPPCSPPMKTGTSSPSTRPRGATAFASSPRRGRGCRCTAPSRARSSLPA